VISQFNRSSQPPRCHDQAPRRHDLVFVSSAAWRSLLATRDDLAGDPLVAGWVDRGWPLVARRFAPEETDGVALGIPLPPFAGKRRIALLMQPHDILSTAPPPWLSDAVRVAPDPWVPTLQKLTNMAALHQVDARVFGSLAWRLLTGLNYLTASSDLDVLLTLPRAAEFAQLNRELAAIDRAAPMRLDGEWVRDDGAAVNWRELDAGGRMVLAKTIRDVRLLDASDFVGGAVSP
jgi:phosphoribosyl-dephospho-CoA transferase